MLLGIVLTLSILSALCFGTEPSHLISHCLVTIKVYLTSYYPSESLSVTSLDDTAFCRAYTILLWQPSSVSERDAETHVILVEGRCNAVTSKLSLLVKPIQGTLFIRDTRMKFINLHSRVSTYLLMQNIPLIRTINPIPIAMATMIMIETPEAKDKWLIINLHLIYIHIGPRRGHISRSYIHGVLPVYWACQPFSDLHTLRSIIYNLAKLFTTVSLPTLILRFKILFFS